jgi:hypothetical protein
MSYNTPADASARCGLEDGTLIPQVCLDDAQSIIHSYTFYRWVDTEVTEKYSGNGTGYNLILRPPINSISVFTIDGVSQTVTTDYELRRVDGILRSYSGFSFGYDNIILTYNYGWISTDEFYQSTISVVKRVEASIALYLWKNPLMAKKLAIENLDFGMHDNHIAVLLSLISRPNLFHVFDPNEIGMSL